MKVLHLLIWCIGVTHGLNSNWAPPANKTLWGKRTIYQVLTDRFDKGTEDTTRCHNFNRYCGGVWKGITEQLPYIKDMGYDAIWFTPISAQSSGPTWQYPDGYHGYWPSNLWEVNSAFGTEAELQEMIDTLHDMDMWAMLDVVPNHVGYSSVAVFNDSSHYHSCSGCVSPNCNYGRENDFQIEHCRLSMLPDLDQNNPYVSDQLMIWHNTTYKKYQIDGYRVDAARHILNEWMTNLTKNVSIFTIGEFAEDILRISKHLTLGALDSSLNFPLNGGIVYSFPKYTMDPMRQAFKDILKYFGPNSSLPHIMPLLGNYVENHDNPRYLCTHPDIRMFENAYATQFFFPGIPITYYGAEMAMNGQRDPLWTVKKNTLKYKEQETYKLLQIFVRVRKYVELWDRPLTVLNVTGPLSDHVVAFARGDDLVVVLNAFRNPPGKGVQLQLSGLPATAKPQTLTDILFPTAASSKLTIEAGGTATFYLSADRWPQVFVASDVPLGDGMGKFTPYQPSYWPQQSQTALICFWAISFVLAAMLSFALHGLYWKLLFRTSFGKLLPKETREKWAAELQLSKRNRYGKFKDGDEETNHATPGAVSPRSVAVAIADTPKEGSPEQTAVVVTISGPTSMRRRQFGKGLGGGQATEALLGKETDGNGSPVYVDSSTPAVSPSARGAVMGRAPSPHAATTPTRLQPQHPGSTSIQQPEAAPDASAPERLPMRQLLVNSTMMRNISTRLDSFGDSDRGSPPGTSTYHTYGGMVSPALPQPFLTSPAFLASPGAAMVLNTPAGRSLAASSRMSSGRMVGSTSGKALGSGLPPLPTPGNHPLATPALPAPPTGTLDVLPESGELQPFASFTSLHPSSGSVAIPPRLSLAVPETMTEDEAEGVHTFTISDSMVLNVAMEYSIPHLADLGFGDGGHFMFGGLGKVVDLFLRDWPGPVGLCCPLYQKAYTDHTTDTVPMFLPASTQPTLAFSVTVSMRHVHVEVFTLQHGRVTYFFIQADIFKHRLKGDIYTFEEEAEMLSWISIMNQCTAVIISTFNCRKVQFHDWHATLSLLYLPAEVRPEVLVILHNAHYNGTFRAPTEQRKLYICGILDLDQRLWPRYLAHKGQLDLLNSVCTWIQEHQAGRGLVAVSPRYAKSILNKIDVLWQMRSYGITGILNALPFTNCLAKELADGKHTIESALAFKARSKAEFQDKFGLNRDGDVGSDPFSGPQLVVFLGRMTHQKGADTIAMAADHFMSKCPQCQLVVVGPICDSTGAMAGELMETVVAKYGKGRVYSPPGAYFGGDDKTLLLAAADFCLVPSRFEPCGLVDIEFGWNGALMVGHDTGGLNKMPGVMYQVESNARSHLAAHLSEAVIRALALTPQQRRQMFEEAMSKRFETGTMMQAYAREWESIHDACISSQREERALQEKAIQDNRQEYFSTLWRKHNKKDVKAVAVAQEYDQGKVLRFIRWATGREVGRHDISFILMLLLQSYCILPAAMVNAYVVFVYLGYTSILGCETFWDASFGQYPGFFDSLSTRILISFGVYTVMAPIWMLLAMNMRPKLYVYMAVFLVLASALVAHASMVWTITIPPAIFVTSAIAPVGLPLISLNFLEQTMEVAEVGLAYMTVTEGTFDLYMMVAAVLAVASLNSLPFVVIFGFCVLAAFLLGGWFSGPDVLHPAYDHVRMVWGKQWKMLTKIKSFWITSLVMMCENVALVLTAYQVLLQWDLRSLMISIAVNFGARMCAQLVTYLLMRMRFSQLYSQRIIMVLASLPGFAIAKQLCAQYASDYWSVLLTFALVEFFYGTRFQLVGLLAFETLPSRELVAVWQLFTMLTSTIVPTVVLAVGFTLQPGYGSQGDGLLIGVIVCEGVRLLSMAVLWKVHPAENLATC